MPSGINRAESAIRVAPIQALGRTALLSGAFSLLPVFAVVGWLTHRSASWPGVIVVEGLLVVAFVTVYIRFRRVYTAVDHTHFVKRRMLLSRVSVERSRVHQVLINRVYRGTSTESLIQLIGVDVLGQRILGMSGLFWSEEDVLRIAEALGVPSTVDPTPLSRSEYHRMFPTARGWYFRRTLLVAVTVLAGIVLFLLVLTLEDVVGNV